MSAQRVEKVRAADVEPGAVLDNVSRLFVVEDRERQGALVRITYRYTDDRSLVQRDSMLAAPDMTLRVRTEADRDLVDGILAATVGLPR